MNSNLDSAFIGEGCLAHFGFSCSLWVLGLLYFLFMSWTGTQTALEAKSYIWWTQFSGGNLSTFYSWMFIYSRLAQIKKTYIVILTMQWLVHYWDSELSTVASRMTVIMWVLFICSIFLLWVWHVYVNFFTFFIMISLLYLLFYPLRHFVYKWLWVSSLLTVSIVLLLFS